MASVEVPLARPDASPVQVTSNYYYGLGIRPIYKSYSVYSPDREPPGYIDRLRQEEPQVLLQTGALKTTAGWIKAGELVFEAPIGYGHIGGFTDDLYTRDPEWQRKVAPPLLPDGTIPGLRYVVRATGRVEIGVLSCAMCHSRVMPDGTLIKGAQGNFPFDRAWAWDYEHLPGWAGPLRSVFAHYLERILFSAPWLGASNPATLSDRLSYSELASFHSAIPPGVIARHGTSVRLPARVPDLIGIKDRRYLDSTGLVRHRDIGDVMRYAAMNQDTDMEAKYLGVAPFATHQGRYSDEELYALAQYLYSLQPPPNPYPFDATAAAGQNIFKRQGCPGCHTPPLYTNNKLTLAEGFTPPPEYLKKYDILPVSVGTDPGLALKTRRGTGFYKVPSLKGVWYRGPFEHNGSVLALEDWFDPQRLRDDYVPTGFKGYKVKTRAVRGHEFGLKLTPEEKRSLIAFLRTL